MTNLYGGKLQQSITGQTFQELSATNITANSPSSKMHRKKERSVACPLTRPTSVKRKCTSEVIWEEEYLSPSQKQSRLNETIPR